VRNHTSRSKTPDRTETADRRPPEYLRLVFDKLDAFELVVVRRQVMLRSRPLIAWLAAGANLLGNGWLYPALAILVVGVFGREALRPVILAFLSVALGHVLYPLIKLYIARSRPASKDEALSLRPPLDWYSCPSGHTMTATAAFLPLGFAFPALGVCLLPLWIMLGWTRIILGHHYPSDLVVGAALGTVWVAISALIFMPLVDTSKVFVALTSP
jgi:undecaprenyl-diphosphatase